MDDLVSRISRELPDTDRDRYDIAYQRGRAQARSTLLFGGLALGAAVGAVATLLLDPGRGRGRRIELSQRLGAVARRASRTAQGKAADLRNRATGKATELGLPGTGSTEVRDGGELTTTGRITTTEIAIGVREDVESNEPVAVGSSGGANR